MPEVFIDAGLKFNGSLTKRSKTTYIVLHHAAAQTYSVQQCHQGHLNKGWAGIGYHFYVRKDGTIYRGRPIDTVGAHVEGFNSCSIGICAEGDYHTKDKTMPTAQKNALIWLVNDLRVKFTGVKVVGHRDLQASSCPGQFFPFDEIIKGEEKPMEQKVSEWAREAWEWAKVKGYLDGTRPKDNLTREEFAVVLKRILG